nr:zinc finger, CCHC-type [Tanacetum cinerariifolium]
MSVRQVWKRKKSTPKSLPSFEKESRPHGSFVGFGYVCNGMIRLNLNYPLFNASACMITSSQSNSISKSKLWHANQGYVHYKRMRDVSQTSLKPAFDMTHESCKTYMLTKITRQPFKGVNRESKVLDLIHSYLCDFHANPSLGHNKAVVRLTEPKMKGWERPRGMIQLSSSKIAKDEVEGIVDVHGVIVPRKTNRTRKAKSFGSDFQLYLVEGTRDKTLSQREYCFIIKEDPRTLSEAMDSRQKEGIDLFDTYALVARISTIRLLLALAAIHDLVIHQIDVINAFLNGDLDEEIYMKQPEGFVMPGRKSKVCKLKKSLSGLKQAPKQWHQKFDNVVLSSGFSLNQADKCVYSKFDASGKGVIICLYVDNMLIFGTDQDQVNKTKEFLSSEFDIKELGEAEMILGIRIKREKTDISISQSHYIEKILTKFNFANCSPVYTLVDPTQALGRVFQYLKGTMEYGLTYSGYPFIIEGYSDASWINNMEDHSFMSG